MATRTLAEQKAETFCLAVLNHPPAALPPATTTQAVNVLKLIFCQGFGPRPSAGSEVPACPPVPKCRMLSKALSLLLNRVEDAMLVGPSAVAAGLQLLLHLASVNSMCSNLLFHASEDPGDAEDDDVDATVAVTLSC